MLFGSDRQSFVDLPGAGAGVLDIAGSSNSGKRRARNEDEFAWFAGGRVVAIADGMAERPNGGLASSLVINEVATSVSSNDYSIDAVERLDVFRAVAWLRHVFASARGALGAARATIAQTPAMETGLILGVLTRHELVVGHVGHSRCYLWRRGELRQLTRDHRRAPRGLDELAEDDRRALRSLVCVADRGVGDASGDDPEITTAPLEHGDAILFCSNGVTDALSAATLARIFDPALTASNLVQELLAASNTAHAEDDATGVVVRIVTAPGERTAR